MILARLYRGNAGEWDDVLEAVNGFQAARQRRGGRGQMHHMNRVQMLEFPQMGDERGHLVVAEGGKDIPFEIKRVFYIYGSDRDVIRGQHANRKTEFVRWPPCLNRPHTGIYLPTMVWKDMYDFSEDSVLLVLASEHYDNTEYIRDYDRFAKEIAGQDG